MLLASCASQTPVIKVFDAKSGKAVVGALVYGKENMLTRPPLAAIAKTDINGCAFFSKSLVGKTARFSNVYIVHTNYFPARFSVPPCTVTLFPLPDNDIKPQDIFAAQTLYMSKNSGCGAEVYPDPPDRLAKGGSGPLAFCGLWELEYAKTTEASYYADEWEQVRRSYIKRGLVKWMSVWWSTYPIYAH
jgi:hypothetical protein